MKAVIEKLNAAKWRIDTAHTLIEDALQAAGDKSHDLIPLLSASKELTRLVSDALEAQKATKKP